METSWSVALWRQFGAAMDMLDNALAACPDSLWRARLWPIPPDDSLPQDGSAFWYVAYHALFWLDFYVTAAPEGEFAPPAPFTLAELDPADVLPERPYTKEELRGYLAYSRQKCRDTLAALTDEQARRLIRYPSSRRPPISYFEMQMYNLRHVQEHAAQLSLFLGQHGMPGETLDWVPFAKGDAGGL